MTDLIQENIPLAPLSYYKIGGSARYFSEPETLEDLKKISEFIQKNNLKFFVLGAGSNLLFSDKGFSGIVIRTQKLNRTLELKDSILEVGCGTKVIDVLRLCMAEGLDGLELLTGIPGSMGGVLYMNAGTHLGEIKDVVVEVTSIHFPTGKKKTFKTKEEIKYSYRKQHFLDEGDIIFSGKLKIKKSEPALVQKKIQELLAKRKNSQPVDKPSCGSVFKNPDPANGVHAWKLIDQAGLRGSQIGNARVSDLHTNFILNLGGARSEDVLKLIQKIQQEVFKQFNVHLETELVVLNY